MHTILPPIIDAKLETAIRYQTGLRDQLIFIDHENVVHIKFHCRTTRLTIEEKIEVGGRISADYVLN